jgi:hypothetical protein
MNEKQEAWSPKLCKAKLRIKIKGNSREEKKKIDDF